MKIMGIIISAALTLVFLVLGRAGSQDFYLAALVSLFVFFRLATGSSCPVVWLLSKLGVKGLACPTGNNK
jgi:hypothetical protein